MASITDRPRDSPRSNSANGSVPSGAQVAKARAARRRLERIHHRLPAGPHRLRSPRAGLHAADLSPLRPAGPGRHPHPGRTHRRQPAPHPGRPGPRPPQQLSPRLLPPPLVRPPPGTPVHRRRPRPLRPRRARPPGRRRHRQRAPRPPRSTARAATATRSAPPTPSPPSAGGTSGSSWPCWSASPSPRRRWALPVLVALYRPEEERPKARGRRAQDAAASCCGRCSAC